MKNCRIIPEDAFFKSFNTDTGVVLLCAFCKFGEVLADDFGEFLADDVALQKLDSKRIRAHFSLLSI